MAPKINLTFLFGEISAFIFGRAQMGPSKAINYVLNNWSLLDPIRSLHKFHWTLIGTWWFCIVSGYLYVSGVLCQRENPLHSGNNEIRDFAVFIVISPLVFLLGPRKNLISNGYKKHSFLLTRLVNYFIPFCVALHWDDLSYAMKVNFSLKSEDLLSLGTHELAVIKVLALTLSLIIYLHIFWAIRSGHATKYVASLIAVPILLWLFSHILGPKYYLHVHHYCVGIGLVPFFIFKNHLSIATQGFFLGLGIEGISRWGFDPLWYPIIS